MERKLLRPNMIPDLVLGDCLMEVNRFTKKFTIYKLIELSDNYAYGEVVACTNGAKKGYTCGLELSAHAYHKNCTWITYYLPAGKVLYG